MLAKSREEISVKIPFIEIGSIAFEGSGFERWFVEAEPEAESEAVGIERVQRNVSIDSVIAAEFSAGGSILEVSALQTGYSDSNAQTPLAYLLFDIDPYTRPLDKNHPLVNARSLVYPTAQTIAYSHAQTDFTPYVNEEEYTPELVTTISYEDVSEKSYMPQMARQLDIYASEPEVTALYKNEPVPLFDFKIISDDADGYVPRTTSMSMSQPYGSLDITVNEHEIIAPQQFYIHLRRDGPDTSYVVSDPFEVRLASHQAPILENKFQEIDVIKDSPSLPKAEKYDGDTTKNEQYSVQSEATVIVQQQDNHPSTISMPSLIGYMLQKEAQNTVVQSADSPLQQMDGTKELSINFNVILPTVLSNQFRPYEQRGQGTGQEVIEMLPAAEFQTVYVPIRSPETAFRTVQEVFNEGYKPASAEFHHDVVDATKLDYYVSPKARSIERVMHETRNQSIDFIVNKPEEQAIAQPQYEVSTASRPQTYSQDVELSVVLNLDLDEAHPMRQRISSPEEKEIESGPWGGKNRSSPNAHVPNNPQTILQDMKQSKKTQCYHKVKLEDTIKEEDGEKILDAQDYRKKTQCPKIANLEDIAHDSDGSSLTSIFALTKERTNISDIWDGGKAGYVIRIKEKGVSRSRPYYETPARDYVTSANSLLAIVDKFLRDRGYVPHYGGDQEGVYIAGIMGAKAAAQKRLDKMPGNYKVKDIDVIVELHDKRTGESSLPNLTSTKDSPGNYQLSILLRVKSINQNGEEQVFTTPFEEEIDPGYQAPELRKLSNDRSYTLKEFGNGRLGISEYAPKSGEIFSILMTSQGADDYEDREGYQILRIVVNEDDVRQHRTLDQVIGNRLEKQRLRPVMNEYETQKDTESATYKNGQKSNNKTKSLDGVQGMYAEWLKQNPYGDSMDVGILVVNVQRNQERRPCNGALRGLFHGNGVSDASIHEVEGCYEGVSLEDYISHTFEKAGKKVGLSYDMRFEEDGITYTTLEGQKETAEILVNGKKVDRQYMFKNGDKISMVSQQNSSQQSPLKEMQRQKQQYSPQKQKIAA